MRNFLSHVKIDFIGELSNACGIKPGPLRIPDGCSVDGNLIAIGEDDMYVHCIISNSGAYYGVFKSEDKNHLYREILRLNT